MDRNFEDALIMGSESMDFDQSVVVVNQEDIMLEEDNQSGEVQMSNIEEQIIMDTGDEEVIISDFDNEDYSAQEYTIQSDNSSPSQELIMEGGIITSQGTTMSTVQTASTPNYIAIKPAINPKPTVRKVSSAAVPRQVAIAPRPPNTPASVQLAPTPKPKPVNLIVNASAVTANTKQKYSFVQGNVKPNTVLAQLGKQLVMLPSNQGQKIKFMTTESGELAQLIPNNKGSKIVVTKLVQGQNSDGSSKVVPKISPQQPTRYVMQQKTIPISLAGRAKVVVTSPVRQKLNITNKKQIVAINNAKMLQQQQQQQGNVQTKRVVITKTPNQNVILKGNTPNTAQPVISASSGAQLHPISVPGKGIQFIKLVQPQVTKQIQVPKVKQTVFPGKNFVLTDAKGNIIQMGNDRVLSTQPPPLIMSTATTVQSKATIRPTKTSKKFVRIAPLGLKSNTKTQVRSSQSLLAPITFSQSVAEPLSNVSESSVSIEEFNEMVEQSNLHSVTHQEHIVEETVLTDHTDEQKLVTDTQSRVSEAETEEMDEHENIKTESQDFAVNVDKSLTQDPDESTQFTLEYEDSNDVAHNETVVTKQEESLYAYNERKNTSNSDNIPVLEQSNTMSVSVEAEVVPYISPTPTPYMENDEREGLPELGVRARKACNCTKSQCLKLYCDCFANGEFCNNCNCNNCHNNLHNEELRQKAIRACLERNPNAFRPKIGKAKTTGADLIRRHNIGCNCKRSGCLKNYCECYEAKIACTSICKCVGCRNVEELGPLATRRDRERDRDRAPAITLATQRQPCNFMTDEVIEAVCQCLVAAARDPQPDDTGDTGDNGDAGDAGDTSDGSDPVTAVIEEFARCLQDIISASQHAL